MLGGLWGHLWVLAWQAPASQPLPGWDHGGGSSSVLPGDQLLGGAAQDFGASHVVTDLSRGWQVSAWLPACSFFRKSLALLP